MSGGGESALAILRWGFFSGCYGKLPWISSQKLGILGKANNRDEKMMQWKHEFQCDAVLRNDVKKIATWSIPAAGTRGLGSRTAFRIASGLRPTEEESVRPNRWLVVAAERGVRKWLVVAAVMPSMNGRVDLKE